MKKIVEYHRAYTPLSNDAGYSGVCTRREIGIEEKVHNDRNYDYKYRACQLYSNKKVSGHMDWSRLPQGGALDSGKYPEDM